MIKKIIFKILKTIGLKVLFKLLDKLLGDIFKLKQEKMNEVEKSRFGTVNIKDLLKGALVALIGVVGGGLYQVFNNLSQTGQFDFTLQDFYTMLLMGVGAALSYLVKNFLSNSEDKAFRKERNKIKKNEAKG